MRTTRRTRMLYWGLFWILVGAFFYAVTKNFITFSWSEDWPLILVIIGIMMIFKAFIYKSRNKVTYEVHDEEDASSENIRGRALKVRVYTEGKEEADVRINVPLSIVKIGAKLSGSLHGSLPDNVREKMRKKGVEIDDDFFDNIDEICKELGKGERIDIVNVYDSKDGEHVHVYVE